MKVLTSIASFTAPVAATCTLTSNNTNVAANDTVTIGSKVYTFKASPVLEGEVDIGSNADGSMTNLLNAINHTGTPGTDYVCASAHPDVTAGTLAAHAFTITAITLGTGGNTFGTTSYNSGAGTMTWGHAHMEGGVDFALTGGVTEETYGIPAQQVTVDNGSSLNPTWQRAMRLTTQAVQILRFGSVGFGISADVLAEIAMTVEPTLTWPPAITTAPIAASCTTATTATFTVVARNNELNDLTYQWKECATIGGTYTNVADEGGVVAYTGGTTASLVVDPATTGRNNYYYECVITSAAGTVTTTPVKLTVTAA